MEKFNFKVGDKVRLEGWGKDDYIEILLLFGEEKDEHLFTAIDIHGSISGNYKKTYEWQPYQEPKPKQKLQKFFISDFDDFSFRLGYYKNKKDALDEWEHAYTEEEFLEKFDVKL